MPRPTLLLPLLAFAAGCGGEPGSSPPATGPVARPIAGGKATSFGGVTFDLPPHWRSEVREGAMLLSPDGANAAGTLEELYLFGTDPAVRSLAGDDMERSIARTVEQLQPGATKTKGPEPATFGELEGRTWTWTATAQDGREAQLRAFGFMGTAGCALMAIGHTERLSQRAADVEAMLGSLAKAKAAPGGADGVREELVGQWIWMSNFTANNGGGLQTNTSLTLRADGSYVWHYDSVSTNPNGAAWGSQDETGSWSATAASMTFRPDRGEPYTQRLEKRNHPKNTSDPMIVLDGKAYVTATARRPW